MIETKPLEIEDIEVPIGTIIKNVDIHNNTIVYNRQIDTVLFHSLHKYFSSLLTLLELMVNGKKVIILLQLSSLIHFISELFHWFF